ncbi:S8 family serine peptidase [Streptomyces sp. NPDC056161]|uniref:S8 family serine peptidase n=1 Tax=Streptomyces sp. NPDC056161 TaxID=3345732 RepID=UPI0035D97358
MRGLRTAALLLGVGTLAGLVVVPADASPPKPVAGHSGGTAAGPVETVTLITGDTVRYRRAGDTVRVIAGTPAARRPETAFVQFTEHGHAYVVPSDAWDALTGGQVDKALFDITGLAAQKLDDRHTDRIGVIVTGTPGTAPKTATPATASVTRTLPRLGVRALSTAKSDATSLWAALTGEAGGPAGARRAAPARGTKIWLDGVVHATLDVSVPLVGAPTAWERGCTGDGVKVAVLDTGIASGHPDLAGKIDAAKNFTGTDDAEDHAGHGTHVASTITGSGAASDGRYRGVAPGVRLLNGKVLDDSGRGSDSSILAGMEWAVQQGAKVINMSLGGNDPSDGTDLMSTEVNELSAASGALFVVAAGNSGRPETVTSPGAADAALTVASTTKQDTLSSFSSRGPRAGDFGLKPEISAPGENITAARAPGAFPDRPGGADYVTLSGTSMATPHVAGAAALLAGAHPDWTGQQVKAALTGSASVLDGVDVFGNGAGRLDVARATGQSVRTVTPSLGLGRIPWPHDPAKPTTAQVDYANDGDSPVTLDLSLSVTDEGGAPVPAGLFSAEPSVTVPAHGTASATVRVAAGAESVGSYEGRLTATAGDTRLVTPVSARVLEQVRTVTVRMLGRSGQPLSGGDAPVLLQSETTGAVHFPVGTSATVQVEVPDGTYRVLGMGLSPSSYDWSATYVARAGLRVDGDRTITLDTRAAKPVTVDLDDPAARPDMYTAYTTLQSDVGGPDDTSRALVAGNFEEQYVLSTEAVPGVTLSYGATWAPPQNRVVSVGDDPFEATFVDDPQAEGYAGDVTAEVADIGEETDPDRVGDVAGRIVLIAPDDVSDPAEPPTQEQFTALLTALKAKGARLVLSYDYLADTSTLPVLNLFAPKDIQRLRDRLTAGQTQVHVVGRPASPTMYALFGAVGSKLPDGQSWHFARAALARLDATYRTPAGDGRRALSQVLTFSDPLTGASGGIEPRVLLPQTRVEYFSPEVSWSPQLLEGLNPDWRYLTTESTAPVTYRAGRRTAGVWGAAPFGPRLSRAVPDGAGGEPLPAAYRDGDRLVTDFPVFSSADPGRVMSPGTDFDSGEVLERGTTGLFRGATEVAANDTPGVADFALPAATDTYRLVVTGTRPAALSTEVRSEWTFTTGHTADGTPAPLDLLDLGFALPLDGHNAAVAGTKVTGTVTVRHQPGTTGTSPVRAVGVDVSYDDGRSWRPAAVQAAGDGSWSLVIPAGGRAGDRATLRASAVDGAGNQVRMTLTRAYGLR